MKARFALFLLFAILSLKLSVVFAQENIFTVWQPDYQKSPYTGNDSSALDTGRRVFIKRCI